MKMNVFSCLPIFFFIITSYLISPSLSDQRTQDLINQICGSVANPGYCFDTLNRNLVSPQTDLPGLTRLTVDISLSFAKAIKTFIQKAKAAEKNAYLQSIYGDCESYYDKVVVNMGGAKLNADKSDFKSMVSFLNLCGRPIIDCQDEIGDLVSEMRDKNRRMRVLLSMGLYEGNHL